MSITLKMKKFRVILAKCCQGQPIRGVENAGNFLINKLQFPYNLSKIETPLFENINIGCQSTYDYVNKSLKNNEFPITIGGDHTIASGTVQASRDVFKDDLHVVWIDAHADINTTETSTTGNYHGMPVASLLGLMEPFVKGKTLLKPSQITYVGLRAVDKLEKTND